MDKEKYLKEKLAEYQEFVVNQVNKNPEHFGDKAIYGLSPKNGYH